MAAGQLGLEGTAAMFNTIRKARVHFLAAEVKVRFARVAHRPTADAVIEFEQAGFFGNVRAWFGGHQAAWRGRWNWCLLIARALPQEPAGSDRDDALLRLHGLARRKGY